MNPDAVQLEMNPKGLYPDIPPPAYVQHPSSVNVLAGGVGPQLAGVQPSQIIYVIAQPGAYIPGAGLAPLAAKSYTGHIILSCFTFWFCGWLFGLCAFVVAMHASKLSSQGLAPDAESWGKCSVKLSWLGIVTGIIAYIIIIIIVSSGLGRN